MDIDQWTPEEDDRSVLGVVVHGPALVAQSEGIGLAVRCVFARPSGLEFELALRAVGVQGEAAVRQVFGEHPGLPSADDPQDGWPGRSELDLVIELDRRRVRVDPCEQSNSGGGDRFDAELRVVTAGLPSDGLVRLVASWPEAGLAEGAVTLTLDSFDDLENRVVRLPTSR